MGRGPGRSNTQKARMGMESRNGSHLGKGLPREGILPHSPKKPQNLRGARRGFGRKAPNRGGNIPPKSAPKKRLSRAFSGRFSKYAEKPFPRGGPFKGPFTPGRDIPFRKGDPLGVSPQERPNYPLKKRAREN